MTRQARVTVDEGSVNPGSAPLLGVRSMGGSTNQPTSSFATSDALSIDAVPTHNGTWRLLQGALAIFCPSSLSSRPSRMADEPACAAGIAPGLGAQSWWDPFQRSMGQCGRCVQPSKAPSSPVLQNVKQSFRPTSQGSVDPYQVKDIETY